MDADARLKEFNSQVRESTDRMLRLGVRNEKVIWYFVKACLRYELGLWRK